MFKNIFILIFTTFIIFSISVNTYSSEISSISSQLDKIQKDNEKLQDQLNKQQNITNKVINKIKTLEEKNIALSEEIKNIKDTPKEDNNQLLQNMIDIPRLEIKGFSDIMFISEDNGDDKNYFSIGMIDFFITSKLTEKISFLTEMGFHPDQNTNSFQFYLERANLKYSFSDFINIKIGRMHTPLGYWNQTYHHGSWLQTSIFRPLIYFFEDDNGGYLPIHSMGIDFSGILELENIDLEYNFDVLNGRGETKNKIQNISDKNNSKALNALITVKIHSLEGLQIGGNIYYDRIPPDTSDSDRMDEINELILGGHLIYITNKNEFLVEVFSISHDNGTIGHIINTVGFYVQEGYKINNFTPYYRFDFIDFDNPNPFFSPENTDTRKHSIGLRWDVFSWNALKIEYDYSDKKGAENEHLFAINTSFAF